MELWLDTVNSEVIENTLKMVEVYGITTNPSILTTSGETPENTINKLLDIQPGFLAIQVTSRNKEDMLNQARRLRDLSDRIIVKIPVFNNGLSAIRTLSQENIPTMATAIFEPMQIYLSILAGANYAAPYLGRIEKDTGDYNHAIGEMLAIIKNNNSKLKLLTASISSKKQIMDCALLGVHAITLPINTCSEMLSNNKKTLECIENFEIDWQSKKVTSYSEIFSKK